MNGNMKARLFGVAGLLVMGGLFAYNWYTLTNKGYYSLKMAAATPILMLMSVLVIIVPGTIVAYAHLEKKLKAMVLVTLIAGGLLSGVNFYAMDHYYAPVAQKPLDKIPPMPGDIARPTPPQAVTDSNKNAARQVSRDKKR